MRQLILFVSLCAIGVLLAPIASAGAAEQGSCKIEGNANFGGPLSKTKGPNTFTFTSTAGECVGEASGKVVAEATVTEGKGELGCATAEGTAKGTLTILSGPEKGPHTFALKVTGALGVVALELTGGIEAHGVATFLTSLNSKECALAEPTTLPFSALAAGTI
jgi:hypothetical protein